ncbi:MAG: hypothetical protein QOH97_4663 [Actinoplanes sp.]|jgi:hypothetical protein|nr:hypothetical protein [Actinoplanes sp.]
MKILSTRSSGRLKIAIATVTAGALAVFFLPGAPASGARAPLTQRGVAAQQIASAPAPGTLTSRVYGTFGTAGTVRGHFDPDRFFVKHGDAYANGVLHATMRKGDGTLVGHATRRITIPVMGGRTGTTAGSTAGTNAAVAAATTCDILHLVLGPLDLDLLGLQVHLNRVVLDIVAASGAGNLLGNLLCAVAGLLDGTTTLSQLRLANILNRILAILRI